MNTVAETLLDRALELSEADRAELASRLLDSLDQECDDDAEESWNAEIRSRLDEIDAGVGRVISNSEAFRMILDEPSAISPSS